MQLSPNQNGIQEPDCANCHGLCCDAPAFDWPHYKKSAGAPCRNLDDDFRCTMWSRLEAEGYSECRSFTCYGAGQMIAAAVARETERTWRDNAEVAGIELRNFQELYGRLYAQVRGTPPPVGITGEVAPGDSHED
ncbi:MAG TPA: hypothetical protein QGF63_04825 [Alphaproteobacteria bacterium]|jgi:hypothetical protein|nr:hypothetical protein [Alphaproteobacteria bacterium]MDP7164064.1 hypothetical protein [Alphaproteobacteria bacterium]MDP7427495.1 hypothetical protein [Alphaproteobacteria bacterium]HJM49156.1 hypothetical protein [Alphaproteobacteria bacterium]|tara:strand:- start:958 stop:1362 length:405 start_codon:yes stop_codon:yes gene_type:complete